MPQTIELQDERLVELLDEALSELRSGRRLETIDWPRRYPDLGSQAMLLLQLQAHFAESAECWRTSVMMPAAAVANNSETLGEDHAQARTIGRYQVHSIVGTGAMGAVYRAHDPELDRLVAIKVPRVDKSSNKKAKFTERFLREARHAASVRHPNVCPIYDAGQHDNQPYVVMAFVDGEPLDARLARIGRFDDVRQAVRLAIQVAHALVAVHSHSIIHRDLKPGNILIDRSGETLLTDFGLAREIETDEQLTVDGIVVGTPSYMPPEQATGENANLGPTTDLYSLGIVLYEMLTGTLPFTGPVTEVLRRIVVEPPAPPIQFRPDLDGILNQIILKAISKSPADRFASADGFADTLQGWLDSTFQPHAVLPEPPLVNASSGHAAPVSNVPSAAINPNNRRIGRLVVAIALSVVICTGLGIWATVGSSNIELKSNQPTQLERASLNIAPAAPVALKGSVEITVWSNPGKTQGRLQPVKNGVPVSRADSGALPLQNGELVHLHATLNRPAYAYLLWVDSDGRTIPLYPWDADHSDALWEAPLQKDAATPITDIHCPKASNRGFAAIGTPGMQHVVLLARSTPLESPSAVLQAALKDLPSSPMSSSREVAYLEWSPFEGNQITELRGIAPGKTNEFDAPVFNVLRERLQKDFELIKVWRFAQIAE